MSDHRTYEISWQKTLAKQQEIFQNEVSETNAIVTECVFDISARYACFCSIMQREANQLDFHFCSSKSGPTYPMFCRKVTRDWDLVWTIEEGLRFCFTPSEGTLIPYLQFRKRSFVGTLDTAKPGDVLLIKYQSIIPGFSTYGLFHNLRELQVIVTSHLKLYSLIARQLEIAIETIADSTD
jgi:hypothetical protein